MKHLTLTCDGTSTQVQLLTEDGLDLIPILYPSQITWTVDGPEHLAELTIKIQGVKLGELREEGNGQD